MTITIPQSEIDAHKHKFTLKTHKVKRPTRSDPAYANVPDRTLAAAQFAWDEAKEADAKHQAFAAEGVVRRAEAEAARRAQQREQDAQRQAAADAKLLEPAWRAFQSAGGTAEAFEKIKPQVLEAARLKAATDAASGAADQMQPKPGNLGRF